MAPGLLHARATYVPVSQSGETRQPLIYAVTGIVTVLTLVVLSLRIWARRIAKARFWWDDWYGKIKNLIKFCDTDFAC